MLGPDLLRVSAAFRNQSGPAAQSLRGWFIHGNPLNETSSNQNQNNSNGTTQLHQDTLYIASGLQ
jgi:hypothetical protein